MCWFEAHWVWTLIRTQWNFPLKCSQAFPLFTDQSLGYRCSVFASLHHYIDCFIWNQHSLAPDDNVWMQPYRESERLSSARYDIGRNQRSWAAQRGSMCRKLPAMGWCWFCSAVGAPPCLFLFSCLIPRQKLLKPTLGSRPELTFDLVRFPPSACFYILNKASVDMPVCCSLHLA